MKIRRTIVVTLIAVLTMVTCTHAHLGRKGVSNQHIAWPTVAFTSYASNLVPNDTNKAWDSFIWRFSGSPATTAVSVTPAGTTGNGGESPQIVQDLGGPPVLSADGSEVAFASSSSDLVRHDTNSVMDVFVRKLRTGVTQRISVSSTGTESNGASWSPTMSADGRFVAFLSWASNLVHGQTNPRHRARSGQINVFVRDLRKNSTTLVSVTSAGIQASDGQSASVVISGNGRFVAFESSASNLLGFKERGAPYNVYVRDLAKRTTTWVSVNSSGHGSAFGAHSPSLDWAGDIVTFESSHLDGAGDSGGVFVRYLKTGKTEELPGPKGSMGGGDALISPDGRVVVLEFIHHREPVGPHDLGLAFDVAVIDLTNHTTRTITSDGESTGPHISADDRFVAFEQGAITDSSARSEIEIFDLQTGQKQVVSVGWDGSKANGRSGSPSFGGQALP